MYFRTGRGAAFTRRTYSVSTTTERHSKETAGGHLGQRGTGKEKRDGKIKRKKESFKKTRGKDCLVITFEETSLFINLGTCNFKNENIDSYFAGTLDAKRSLVTEQDSSGISSVRTSTFEST